MSSYAITGASRGIGWEFLRQISADANNTIIAIVRNKPGTEKRLAEEFPERKNIHVVQGDLNDYASLESAAAETAKITGGGLDYLIANAALLLPYDAFDSIDQLLIQDRPGFESYLNEMYRTNVIGNIYLFHLFTPLVIKGTVKKVIHISSGHADTNWITKLPILVASGYALAKAATNIVTAKYAAEYGKGKEGVLFINICPGFTDTGNLGEFTQEQLTKMAPMIEAFQKHAPPTFTGPRAVEDSVRDVLSVIDRSTVEKDGGVFISHRGDQQWLS
ncbi:hypothetical protein BJX70DRAFT_355059 [Aspergillus crustosus]